MPKDIFMWFIYFYFTIGRDNKMPFAVKMFADNLFMAHIPSQNRVRMILPSEFGRHKEYRSIVFLEDDGDDYVYINFCARYLTSMTDNPGINTTGNKTNLCRWKMVNVPGGGFRFEQGGRCLVMLDYPDPATDGHYLNIYPCDSKYKNVFERMPLSPIDYEMVCEPSLDKICRRAGYEPVQDYGPRKKTYRDFEDGPPRRKACYPISEGNDPFTGRPYNSFNRPGNFDTYSGRPYPSRPSDYDGPDSYRGWSGTKPDWDGYYPNRESYDQRFPYPNRSFNGFDPTNVRESGHYVKYNDKIVTAPETKDNHAIRAVVG